MAIRHEVVPNKVAVNYHGVTIYQTYEDDNIFNPPNEFIFSKNPFGSEKDVKPQGNVFDVRTLKTYNQSMTALQNLLLAIDEEEFGETNIHEREAGVSEYVSESDGADEHRCPVCNAYLPTNAEEIREDRVLNSHGTCHTVLEYACQCPQCRASLLRVYRLEFDGYEVI